MIAVMVASSIVHGIRYDTVAVLIGAALLLGLLNAFVRPFLLILGAPLILLTLGLFILVVNGLMLLVVPSIVIGFHVDTFGSAFWGRDRYQHRQLDLERIFSWGDGRPCRLHHPNSACPRPCDRSGPPLAKGIPSD